MRTSGPALLEPGQGVGDAHVLHRDQVVGQADIQLAAQVLVQAVDLGAKALQRRQQLLGALVHLAAFFGQGKAGAAALAQTQTEALFEVAHLLADRRAADAQGAFRRGKTAAFHHAAEQLEQADIKVTDLGQWIGTASAHCSMLIV